MLKVRLNPNSPTLNMNFEFLVNDFFQIIQDGLVASLPTPTPSIHHSQTIDTDNCLFNCAFWTLLCSCDRTLFFVVLRTVSANSSFVEIQMHGVHSYHCATYTYDAF